MADSHSYIKNVKEHVIKFVKNVTAMTKLYKNEGTFVKCDSGITVPITIIITITELLLCNLNPSRRTLTTLL